MKLNRRRFLQSSATLAGAALFPPLTWGSGKTDVLIIGAGLIQKEFYKALPEAKGSVRFVKVNSWQQQPMSKGTFAVWHPGQISRYSESMAKPAGRLHFAGEHTGI